MHGKIRLERAAILQEGLRILGQRGHELGLFDVALDRASGAQTPTAATLVSSRIARRRFCSPARATN